MGCHHEVDGRQQRVTLESRSDVTVHDCMGQCLLIFDIGRWFTGYATYADWVLPSLVQVNVLADWIVSLPRSTWHFSGHILRNPSFYATRQFSSPDSSLSAKFCPSCFVSAIVPAATAQDAFWTRISGLLVARSMLRTAFSDTTLDESISTSV